MANVYLWDPAVGKFALPDIKYIGSAPALPVTISPGTEEVEMSDKSRRLAFFGADERVWREWVLAWGYLEYTQLTTLTRLVEKKKILSYENEFEALGTVYKVYIVSFSYEFVRTGIRKLKKFKADMTLREVKET